MSQSNMTPLFVDAPLVSLIALKPFGLSPSIGLKYDTFKANYIPALCLTSVDIAACKERRRRYRDSSTEANM